MAKGRRPAGPRTVERKIHFYRIAPADERLKGKRLDLAPVVAHLTSLAAPARYEGPDDDRVTCEVDRATPPYRLRLRRVRSDVLPMLEDTDTGAVRPLSLRAREGVTETTHLVAFADGTIAAEFNFFGPRASRLAGYLFVKAAGVCPPFHLEAILNPETAERLRRLDSVRVLHLKVRASYIPAIRQANQTVGDALAALQAAGQAQTVELTLGPQPYDRTSSLSADIGAFVRRLARRPDLRNGDVKNLDVEGYDRDDGKQVIDLLTEQLMTTVDVVKVDSRTRAIDSDSAYGGIEGAYQQFASEIQKASSVR